MKGRTYRYFGGAPLYPFGYGLSYTSFGYGRPVVARRSIRAGDAVDVTVAVRNSGSRDGDEVVQLYVARRSAPSGASGASICERAKRATSPSAWMPGT
jgi:beta-glucosidase